MSASGAALSYQWLFNGGTISGATSATLTLDNVSSAHAGTYQVIVSNAGGEAGSTIVTLSVDPAPAISTQPVSITVNSGQNASFGVAAFGAQPLTYQWRKDGVAIGGATSATLTVPTEQTSNGGSYTVVVTNAAGSVTSSAAVLTVNVPPAITGQPVAQTLTIGQPATFSVIATGAPTPTYQWRKDSVAIGGATNAVLTVANAQTSNAGSYTVVVTNAAGSVTSNPAVLNVNVAPAITSQPVNQTTAMGLSVTFSVTATGIPAPTYQWRNNGVSIVGATSSTLKIDSAKPSDSGSYTVVITNAAGSVTSTAGALTVEFSRLTNLSILTSLASAGDSFTMGYVVGGGGASDKKPLVIRAAGPSLAPLGVPGHLNDPKLELFAISAKTGENNDWGGAESVANAMAAVGAFGYIGPGSRDAAAVLSVASGDNSVKVLAADNGTGTVIAEIYDATPPESLASTTPRLINVSVIKQLGTGFTVGFVVDGNSKKNVLIRAIGPTLESLFGVAGAVSNPQLSLYSGKTVIAENNDWGGGLTLDSAFSSVGAFRLSSTSRDAALVASLIKGNYTVQVSGVDGATGTVLVEIYELP